MAQDVSTEKESLQQVRGAEYVYSHLNDQTSKNSNDLATKLLQALGKKDALECLKLLDGGHDTVLSEYENFQNDCEEANKKEQQREGRFHCDCRNYCIKIKNFCLNCPTKMSNFCHNKCKPRCCSNSSKESNDEQQSSEPQGSEEDSINDETKLNWIKILSNPLFIGLEWLWRTESDCPCKFCKLVGKEKKNKEDVIESSLHDAYLLDETSSLKHYNSRDVYRESAEAYETFAVGVLEKASQNELYQIMDIKGEGCLLKNNPNQHRNFIQSLSLLKSAVNKGRKKFVSSPRCQAILDAIIFYKMRDWQDKSMAKKFFWSLWQFVVILPLTPIYAVFVRPPMKIWRDIRCLACIEKLYEHPYNKFANHISFYIVFLGLLFASTFGFEHEYRTSTTGLSSIDYAVLVFLVGFLLQEIWEVSKQGFRIYISKWWNVVDTITFLTLLAAYTVWLSTWLSVYKEWQPRKNAFIVADVLYASATVLAFFHLAHAFQVSSTLGPLQLSLYRMLKDVAKFLFIFLMLFIAFATGLIKIYSYYVVSQAKLREEGESKFQDFHPYAEHEITFISLVWLLVGYVEEDKIRVDDPAFYLTQLFGRLGFLIYLVCTVIVALNMLIAMMNNSFDRVMGDEDKEWKFSRAQMWLEYIDKGNAIPVPFNLLYYTFFILILIIGKLVCCIKTKCCGCKCNEKREERKGTVELQASPKPTRAEENVEEDNPQQVEQNVEQGSKDQTSGDSIACCICHGCFCCCKSETENKRKETSGDSIACCIFHGCFCYCKPETENKRKETSGYSFASCICDGCSCYCKPEIEYNRGEGRGKVIASCVKKYVNQMRNT